MATQRDGTIVYDRSIGSVETLPLHSIPEGMVKAASNVRMSGRHVLRPRPGSRDLVPDIFSGPDPTSSVQHMFRGPSNAIYLVHAGGNEIMHLSAGTTTAITLIDTAVDGDDTTGIAYNGKIFLAYNSSANRLHVLDAATGTARRVGLGNVSAPTVANTGAGAYAATIRYYKVQMRIYDAGITRVVAASELSTATSFTPSGAGTAARVTRPTPVDGATHWVVFASADNVTFYAVSGAQLIATTTWDDTATPSTYSGTVAPIPGLFVPPPSAKFLATNGERLFMAGSYETTAATGETTPATRRVWFTRPLGALGQGDDESITQTGDSRYYLDIDSQDGSIITALCSAQDGTIYVGMSTSVWRLHETGDASKPFRAERIVGERGPRSAFVLAAGDPHDASRVYFMSNDGPYRWSPSVGLEWLGADWCPDSSFTSPLHCTSIGFDGLLGVVLYAMTGDSEATVRVLDPSLQQRVDGELRGGWSRWAYNVSGTGRIWSILSGQDDTSLVTYLGGGATAAFMLYHDIDYDQDPNGAFTASVTLRQVIPDPVHNVRTQPPYLIKPRQMGVSLTLMRNFGGDDNEFANTVAADGLTGGQSLHHRKKVENAVMGDAFAVGALVSSTTHIAAGSNRHLEGLDQIILPYTLTERG